MQWVSSTTITIQRPPTQNVQFTSQLASEAQTKANDSEERVESEKWPSDSGACKVIKEQFNMAKVMCPVKPEKEETPNGMTYRWNRMFPERRASSFVDCCRTREPACSGEIPADLDWCPRCTVQVCCHGDVKPTKKGSEIEAECRSSWARGWCRTWVDRHVGRRPNCPETNREEWGRSSSLVRRGSRTVAMKRGEKCVRKQGWTQKAWCWYPWRTRHGSECAEKKQACDERLVETGRSDGSERIERTGDGKHFDWFEQVTHGHNKSIWIGHAKRCREDDVK